MRLRVILCVLAAATVSCMSPEERRAQVFAEVDRLTVQGQIERAIGVLQAALRSNPSNNAFLVALTDLQLRAEQCWSARRTLLRIRDDPGELLLQARAVARCEAPIVALEAAWVAGLGRDPELLQALPFLARPDALRTRSQGLLNLLERMKQEGDVRTLRAWLYALRGAPPLFQCAIIARRLGSEVEGWQCLTSQSPPTLHTAGR